MAFRFLHLADVHLETRFGGKTRTRERLREATLEAFARALEYAQRERLHAVLVAGDLFDEELLSLRTEFELVRRVRALAESGVWFLCAAGNHDPGAPDGRAARLFADPAYLRIPSWRERVHLFDTRTPQAIVVSDEAGCEVGVVVGAGHASSHESENIAARFHKIESGLPLVGLLHTQVESATAANLHQRYAPSTVQDYQRLPYAYFALGHVHLRQQALPNLPAWYAGNLQGRNARECGQKGGLLVTVDARASATPTFVPFAPVRWEQVLLAEASGLRTPGELCDALVSKALALREQCSEELSLRLELPGAMRFQSHIDDRTSRQALEEEVAQRAGLLEAEIRCSATIKESQSPTEAATPSSLSLALELVRQARCDDELLNRLAPSRLAGFDEHGASSGTSLQATRLDYLRRCTLDLERELRLRQDGLKPQ